MSRSAFPRTGPGEVPAAVVPASAAAEFVLVLYFPIERMAVRISSSLIWRSQGLG